MTQIRILAVLLALGLASQARADDTVRDPERRMFPLAAQRTIPPNTKFDQDTASGNRVHMTVTNYGFYGNNFFNRSASLEYPGGRGYEHMVRGGLWVGAHAQDTVGAFTGVVTGTVDAAQGPTSPEGSEFTPSTKASLKRSTQLASPYYDRNAISELDVICDFDDLSLTTAASNSEPHRPMHLSIRQETYQWNFAEFAHVLFIRLRIKNTGPILRDLHVGIYTEFASGNKNGYTNWPPSSGDPGGLGSWFNNKYLVYDDSLNLFREHYCDAMNPYGDISSCLFERAPYWIGLRYLGNTPLAEDTTTKHLTLSSWSWSPGNAYRDSDLERYALMSAGTIQPLNGDSLRPGTGDPVAIFCAGPFPVLYNDSTVIADFAFVGGATEREIQINSKAAQFAYDNNFILPVPPDAPLVKVVPSSEAVTIYWNNISESTFDITSPYPNDFEGYRTYIGTDPDTLARVGQYDSAVAPGDTTGFNTGFGAVKLNPPAVLDGVTYQYAQKVTGLKNGYRYYCGVTAYDLGNTAVSSIESGLSVINRVAAIPGPAPGEKPSQGPIVFPNPYRVEADWDQGRTVRDHYLWFTNLPERCTVRVYTLSGDIVYEKEFDGATYHGEGTRGLYNPAGGLGAPSLSGTTMAWNMITTEGQAIATGLYLFSVENRANGKTTIGKFLVVKSDREGAR